MKRFPVACVAGLVVAAFSGCGDGARNEVTPVAQNAPAPDRLLHRVAHPHWVLDRLGARPEREISMGRSHISPGAKNAALLYVSDSATSTVNIYSYSSLSLVGALVGFLDPQTLCVDAANDVYVPDFLKGRITKYGHGGLVPIEMLTDRQGSPLSCGVDAKTGNLAVANVVGPNSSAGNVVVYRNAKGNPVKYTAPGFAFYFFVGYDDDGNLFLDGVDAGSNTVLAELPSGKSAFKLLHPNQKIDFPGGLAWDGAFLAIDDGGNNTIRQFKISGSKALAQSSTTLDGADEVFQISFTGGSSKHPQATVVIGSDPNGEAVDIWDYPAGGAPVKTIASGLYGPSGVAVSK